MTQTPRRPSGAGCLVRSCCEPALPLHSGCGTRGDSEAVLLEWTALWGSPVLVPAHPIFSVCSRSLALWPVAAVSSVVT